MKKISNVIIPTVHKAISGSNCVTVTGRPTVLQDILHLLEKKEMT